MPDGIFGNPSLAWIATHITSLRDSVDVLYPKHYNVLSLSTMPDHT